MMLSHYMATHTRPHMTLSHYMATHTDAVIHDFKKAKYLV